MTSLLDIADVAAAAGLSSRALRFYEARGLIQPLRTSGGRRVFGQGEMERLHAIVALNGPGSRWRRSAGCWSGPMPGSVR